MWCCQFASLSWWCHLEPEFAQWQQGSGVFSMASLSIILMASNNLQLTYLHHTDKNNPNELWDISLAHVLPYIIEGEEFMNFTAAHHQGATERLSFGKKKLFEQVERWSKFTILLHICLIWASLCTILLLLSADPPWKTNSLVTHVTPAGVPLCFRHKTKIKVMQQAGSKRRLTISHNATFIYTADHSWKIYIPAQRCCGCDFTCILIYL